MGGKKGGEGEVISHWVDLKVIWKPTGCSKLGCSPETGALLQAFIPIFKRGEPSTLVPERGCHRATHREQNSSAPVQAACSLPYLVWTTVRKKQGRIVGTKVCSCTLGQRPGCLLLAKTDFNIFASAICTSQSLCPTKSTSSLLLLSRAGMSKVRSEHWHQWIQKFSHCGSTFGMGKRPGFVLGASFYVVSQGKLCWHKVALISVTLPTQQQPLKEKSWEFLKCLEELMGKSYASQNISPDGQIFRQLRGGG